MNKTPTIAGGVAIAAGGMLAAALVTPTLSASADGDGDGDGGTSASDHHERASSARAFPPYRCDGGKTKRVWNHGMRSGYVSIAPGTSRRLTPNIRFRGPKRRRDTLTVTVSGVTHNDTATGSSRLQVTVNGRPMRPNELTYFTPFSSYDGSGQREAHTVQFCRKVNRGVKRVRVRFHAYNDDVHVEGALVHAELSN